MIILGIDPGLSGGLAWVNEDGLVFRYTRMPTLKEGKKTVLDEVALRDIIAAHGIDHVFLEKQQAMRKSVGKKCPACKKFPQQGVVAVFSNAANYGILRGMIVMARLPHTLVASQTWQAEMFKDTPKRERKGRSKELAKQIAGRLWPDKTFLASKRSRKPHEGMIDAAMIAEYGRRRLQGETS